MLYHNFTVNPDVNLDELAKMSTTSNALSQEFPEIQGTKTESSTIVSIKQGKTKKTCISQVIKQGKNYSENIYFSCHQAFIVVRS